MSSPDDEMEDWRRGVRFGILLTVFFAMIGCGVAFLLGWVRCGP